MKWKKREVSLTSSRLTRKPMNTFLSIANLKVPGDEFRFDMIAKDLNPGMNTNRKITRWIWRQPWALN